VDLEIAIINLISQIPMSIWLYNTGQIAVASTWAMGGIQSSPSNVGEGDDDDDNGDDDTRTSHERL